MVVDIGVLVVVTCGGGLAEQAVESDRVIGQRVIVDYHDSNPLFRGTKSSSIAHWLKAQHNGHDPSHTNWTVR